MVVVEGGLPLLFGPDVLRHQVGVVHELLRLAERVSIHALYDVLLRLAASAAVGDLIGPVYIAGLDLLIAHEFALDAECLADLLQLVLHLHRDVPSVFSISTVLCTGTESSIIL